MRKRIHLHGPFKAFHDGPIEIEADTVWEAIEAISFQLPGFAPDLNGMKRAQVIGYDTIEKLRTPTDDIDIHIIPRFYFAKSEGLGDIAIGLVLIAASFVPGLQFLASAGVGLVVGGLMQMLTPQPSAKTADKEGSKYIAQSQNTVKIGTHIPILYGRGFIGGHLMSLVITAKNAPA